MNQPAQDGFVADDLDVVLDRRPVGHAVEQAGNIADIANRLQVLAPVELVDERDQVDRMRGLGQVHHPRVNAAMGVDGEVLGLQMLGGIVVGVIVEQDGAQDRAFRFNVRRHAADTGVDGCHDV